MIKRILLAATLLLSGNLYAVTISGKPTAYTFNGSWTGANSTPAPTSYYHFDEGSGTALADIGTDGSYDISSFTGTPDWQTCGGVDCLNFDGSTEWIDVAGGWGTAQSTTDLTICAIHIADAHGAQDSTIVGVGNTSSGNDDYLLMGNNTAPKYNAQYRLNGTLTSDIASSARDDSGTAKFHCLVWDQSAKNATVYEENGTTIGVSANPATIGAFTNNVGRIAGTPESGTPSEIFDGKIVALYIWKSTALSAAQIQDVYNSDDPWPFLTPSGSCPATCAGGRSARCITDISDASDPDNLLYGLSPAATANEDTVCYDPSSVLGDTVNVTAAGWPSIASGGSQLTDSFDYCIMDNGAACGTDGTYEVTFQPVITSVTGIGTGQTTGTVTVTPAGPTEGTVRGVAISKTSYDTYGAPTHAQIAAGVDGNNANVAWGSEFTKSFLSTVSPGWTFGRASSQTYEKSDGTLGTVTSGNPAFTYSGGTAQGVLLEGSRTNLLTYSEQFDNAAWNKQRVTVSANSGATTDPAGTNLADKLVEDGTAGNTHRIYQNVTTTAAAYTVSFYAKAAERSWVYARIDDSTTSRHAWFDLTNGVTGTTETSLTSRIVSVGNGWYRCSATVSTALASSQSVVIGLASADNTSSYNGDGSSGLYLYGAQVELGAFSSSYVPTTTAPVTRQPTSLTRSWNFPSNNFSGQIKVRPQFNGTASKGGTFSILTMKYDNNNYARITFNSTTDRVHLARYATGTSGDASTTSTELGYTSGQLLNIRFKFTTTGVYLWVDDPDSSTVDSCTSADCLASFTNAPTTIRLGDVSADTASTGYLMMAVESLTIWNEAKSDAFLEALE